MCVILAYLHMKVFKFTQYYINKNVTRRVIMKIIIFIMFMIVVVVMFFYVGRSLCPWKTPLHTNSKRNPLSELKGDKMYVILCMYFEKRIQSEEKWGSFIRWRRERCNHLTWVTHSDDKREQDSYYPIF